MGGKALRVAAAAVLTLIVIVLTACSSSTSGPSSRPGVVSDGSSGTPRVAPGAGEKFYVSIGDSYAAGYQPAHGSARAATTTDGFAYQLPALADAKGYHLRLVNFGCSGATTTSLLESKGCPSVLLGPGAPSYPTQTQAEAAMAFIAAHRGEVGLVTVAIGGNDITRCGRQPSARQVTCLTEALTTVKTNLARFLKQLRAVTGPDVPVIGLTYPDVLLGNYVSKVASQRALATLSVTAFKSLVNPALRAQYATVKATFIDVTAGSGAYTPVSQTTTLAPYGTIPVAVAKVCQLTFFCEQRDIHPRNVGYALIARLITAALPQR